MHGEVVQRDRCRLIQRNVVGQWEHLVGVDRNGFGETTDRRHGRNPVPGSEAAGILADHPGHVPSRDEGHLRTQLVLAAGVQHVGEDDPRVVHVDQDLARLGSRLGDIVDLDCIRTGDLMNHCCAHGSPLDWLGV